MLWRHLRDRQLAGFKFVRQEPIGPYFADFVCRDLRLVIEVDGGQHADSAADAKRDAMMRALGYKIIRVWNNDVLGNTEGILQMLKSELEKAPHPVPLPASGEREPIEARGRRDPSVVVIGEDVPGGASTDGQRAAYGGALGVTKGLISG